MNKFVLLILALMGAEFFFEAPVNALECPALNIKVEENLISIHVTDQPLSCVLDQVGQQTGVSIKVWRNIDEPITLGLNRVSLTRFFQTIGDGNALVYEFFPEKNQYRLIKADIVESSLPKSLNSRNRETEVPVFPAPGNKIANPLAGPSHTFVKMYNKKSEKSDVQEKPKQRPMVKPGELLVRFKENVKDEQKKELHAFLGSTVVRKIDRLGLERLKLDPELTIERAVHMYLASGIVQSAEPHAVRYLSGHTPNDPMFSEQWGLTAVKASDAWMITRGNREVVVAVIDTGVDYNHPDLRANIWQNMAEARGIPGVDDDNNGYVDDIFGWDFADQDCTPLDMDGHGTHVAGILGAVTDNGTGIAGVCPNIKIMVLKIQGDGNDEMETFDIIEAVEYAKNQGVNIINCSLGGDSYQEEEFLTFESFQDQNNGLIVCAAGNESVDIDLSPLYPASYDLPGIVSVAASAEISSGKYGLADFSNYGALSVDVMAPGDNIFSTVPKTDVTETDAYFTIGASPIKYPANGFLFGGITNDQVLKAELVDCGYGYPEEISDSVSNRIALILRGGRGTDAFNFSEKIANVQERGAVGAIIYNNERDDFIGTLGTPDEWIPAIAVSGETGLYLKSQIPVSVALFNIGTTKEVFYQANDGTSMAAPFVSGGAAMLRGLLPDASFLELKQLILTGVDPIDSLEQRGLTKGQINLFKTLAQIRLPGDFNKDYKTNLEDEIMGLKILSGSPCEGVNGNIFGWDGDNDSRLGGAEIIRILQY